MIVCSSNVTSRRRAESGSKFKQTTSGRRITKEHGGDYEQNDDDDDADADADAEAEADADETVKQSNKRP